MKEVFADTSSYFIALLNQGDRHHAKASTCSKRVRGRIVVTEQVLYELGSALSKRGDRRLFVDLVKTLRSDADTLLIAATSDLLNRGLGLFSRRLDKEWSLIDCISFVVMKDRSISVALTTDHHFEQAGFEVLLK